MPTCQNIACMGSTGSVACVPVANNMSWSHTGVNMTTCYHTHNSTVSQHSICEKPVESLATRAHEQCCQACAVIVRYCMLVSAWNVVRCKAQHKRLARLSILGSRSALIRAIKAPGHNGMQAGLLHQRVAAHVTLPTPHQISSLPFAS